VNQEAKYKKALVDLVACVKHYLSELDKLMARPPDHRRGRQIGALTTRLDIAADSVRYGVLDIDFRTGKPRKRIPKPLSLSERARVSELIDIAVDNDANGTGESLRSPKRKKKKTARKRREKQVVS
jgi:hypothetical protein